MSLMRREGCCLVSHAWGSSGELPGQGRWRVIPKPQPGHGVRRRPRVGAAARVGEPFRASILCLLCRGTAGHTATGRGARLCVHLRVNLWLPLPTAGLASLVHLPGLQHSSTPLPEALTARAALSSKELSHAAPSPPGLAEAKPRSAGKGPAAASLLGSWGDTATREGHLVSILLNPLLCWAPLWSSRLSLASEAPGAGLGIQKAVKLAPAEGRCRCPC